MWGSNEHGQLGLEDKPHAPVPTQINSLRGSRLVGVALGNRHTIVWGHSNEHNGRESFCYVFGENCGQLGLPEPSQNSEAVAWQPRKVSHISADRYVIAQVSTTSLQTVCLTTNDDAIIFKDYVCRRIPPPGTRFPKRMPCCHNSLYNNTDFGKYRKVACTKTGNKTFVTACLSKVGNVYLWVANCSAVFPVLWDIPRRSFAVEDLCLGQGVDDTVAIAVVAEDDLVYTGTIKIGKRMKNGTQEFVHVTPHVVKGLHQVQRLWTGPQLEHLICIRTPRSAGQPNEHEIDLVPEAPAENRISEEAEVKVTISAGGDRCEVAMRSLMQSPFFSACLSGRWDGHSDDGEDVSADNALQGKTSRENIELPIELSSVGKGEPGRLLQMLAAYLEKGTAHVEAAEFEPTFNLLVIADAVLLDGLKHTCEDRLAQLIDTANLKPAFDAAMMVGAAHLGVFGAHVALYNLEMLMASRQLVSFTSEQLQLMKHEFGRLVPGRLPTLGKRCVLQTINPVALAVRMEHYNPLGTPCGEGSPGNTPSQSTQKRATSARLRSPGTGSPAPTLPAIQRSFAAGADSPVQAFEENLFSSQVALASPQQEHVTPPLAPSPLCGKKSRDAGDPPQQGSNSTAPAPAKQGPKPSGPRKAKGKKGSKASKASKALFQQPLPNAHGLTISPNLREIMGRGNDATASSSERQQTLSSPPATSWGMAEKVATPVSFKTLMQGQSDPPVTLLAAKPVLGMGWGEKPKPSSTPNNWEVSPKKMSQKERRRRQRSTSESDTDLLPVAEAAPKMPWTPQKAPQASSSLPNTNISTSTRMSLKDIIAAEELEALNRPVSLMASSPMQSDIPWSARKIPPHARLCTPTNSERSSTPNFADILVEQTRSQKVAIKELNKSLVAIQIEEKAVDEVRTLYDLEEEAIISIRLVPRLS